MNERHDHLGTGHESEWVGASLGDQTNEVAPGRGERRALAGYVPQYRVAAQLTYRALQDRTLEFIRLADPAAGHVDDFLLGTASRVDAYQIKWERYPGAFSFANFVGRPADDDNLVAQLAAGWKKLQASNPTRRVVVHLFTNRTPSTSDLVSPSSSAPPRHFAAFLETAWAAAKSSSNETGTIDEKWTAAWERLRLASRLRLPEFEHFVRDCELDFAADSQAQVFAPSDPRYRLDIDQLAGELLNAVASPRNIVALTRRELLLRLNWLDRFSPVSTHEFPPPTIPYRPVDSTVKKLEETLGAVDSGYILLLGTPGSGKSTCATKILQERRERVIRYYVHVPESGDITGLRGESASFLHDVVVAIENGGVRAPGTIPGSDQAQLAERLRTLLQMLHDEWTESGRKTVVLVDGLDHIQRELRPNRSLLLDLPVPNAIPSGVVFLLSSQTDELDELPPRVQHQLLDPARRVTMDPLAREAVLAIVSECLTKHALSNKQLEEIHAECAGHPLALAYILNSLKAVANADELTPTIQEMHQYDGHIDSQYYAYWTPLAKDGQLRRLLGLMARVPGALDLEWISTWGMPDAVEALRRGKKQYFRIESENRWNFFHNSFRIFLVDRTAEASPGEIDQQRDRAIYAELADLCRRPGTAPRNAWNELRYLMHSGNDRGVVARASQQYFRDQVAELRPLDAIQQDIKAALRSAGKVADVIAVGRLMLIASETWQRRFNLEERSIAALLVRLNDIRAIDHIRDGHRLRITQVEALNLSVELLSSGLLDEARRTFEMAEPHALLAGDPIERDAQQDKRALLGAWSRAAPHFRPVEEVVRRVRGVHVVPNDWEEQSESQATSAMQRRSLLAAGKSYLGLGAWDAANEISETLDDSSDDGLHAWFWLRHHGWWELWRNQAREQAQALVSSTWDRVSDSQDKLSDSITISMAEALFRILGDSTSAIALLRRVAQPNIDSDFGIRSQGLESFTERFLLNRLLHALNLGLRPEEIVPEGDARQAGQVLLERAICRVAEISGRAWAGTVLHSWGVGDQVLPIIRAFNRTHRETRDWSTWFAVVDAKAELFEWLIEALSQHGPQIVSTARNLFEADWKDARTARFWSAEAKRRSVMAFARLGAPRTWIVAWLTEFENEADSSEETMYERLEHLERQASAWTEVGERERAEATVQRLVESSFGIGSRKDYQLDADIRWLKAAAIENPDVLDPSVPWIAGAIVSLEPATEGRVLTSAAEELVGALATQYPRRSVRLFRWFDESGATLFEAVLKRIVELGLVSNEEAAVTIARPIALRIVLPLEVQGDDKFTAATIHTFLDNPGAELERAGQLLAEISTQALPTRRRDWLRALTLGLTERGIDQSGLELVLPTEPDDGGTVVSSLKSREGTPIENEDIVSRMLAGEDILVLLNSLDPTSYGLTGLITLIASSLDASSLVPIAELFAPSNEASRIASALSHRAFELGDLERARSLADRALASSEARGWLRWHDGASRASAYRSLIALDDSFRAQALSSFILDVTTEYWYPRELAEELEQLLPLFTARIPTLEMWREIEDHLRALFHGASLSGARPDNEFIDRDSLPDALFDLLLWCLRHPVQLIANAAQKALTDLLSQKNATAQHRCINLLTAKALESPEIMTSLEAASLVDGRAVSAFERCLPTLTLHSDFSVRTLAQDLCRRHELTCVMNTDDVMRLPALYSIVLPHTSAGVDPDLTHLPEGAPLPDSSDPAELVGPFRNHLRIVAREAGVPLDNVMHRAALFMRDPVLGDWTETGEESLKEQLKSTGLEYTYVRPRSRAARYALDHVVSELVDARLIGDEGAERLRPVLRIHDFRLMLLAPVARPAWIEAIDGLDRYSVPDGWLANVRPIRASLVDAYVLAEETNLWHRGHELATEDRQTTVIAHGRDPVRELTNATLADYPGTGVDDGGLILSNSPRGIETPGAGWLALEPGVAEKLGWSLSEGGIFRWIDAEGNKMVESLWWRDGVIGHGDRHDIELGEGWLVIATPAAWFAIRSQYGEFTCSTRVTRTRYKATGNRQTQRLSNSAAREERV